MQDEAFVFYLEGKKMSRHKNGVTVRRNSKTITTSTWRDATGDRFYSPQQRSGETVLRCLVAAVDVIYSGTQQDNLQRGIVAESYQRVIEPDIQLSAPPWRIGSAENTLIVAMADNGPITRSPPRERVSAKACFVVAKATSPRAGPASRPPPYGQA